MIALASLHCGREGISLVSVLAPCSLGNHEGTSQVISKLCTLVSVACGTWSEEEGGCEKVWGQVPECPRQVSALPLPVNIVSVS